MLHNHDDDDAHGDCVHHDHDQLIMVIQTSVIGLLELVFYNHSSIRFQEEKFNSLSLIIGVVMVTGQLPEKS